MLVRYALQFLLVVSICGIFLIVEGDVENPAMFANTAKGEVREMPLERWSAEFVDLNDAGAVQRWARGMCKGLKIAEVAQELETAPTVMSVAQRLTSGMPEPAEAIARRTCEEELSKASDSSTTMEGD